MNQERPVDDIRHREIEKRLPRKLDPKTDLRNDIYFYTENHKWKLHFGPEVKCDYQVPTLEPGIFAHFTHLEQVDNALKGECQGCARECVTQLPCGHLWCNECVYRDMISSYARLPAHYSCRSCFNKCSLAFVPPRTFFSAAAFVLLETLEIKECTPEKRFQLLQVVEHAPSNVTFRFCILLIWTLKACLPASVVYNNWC